MTFRLFGLRGQQAVILALTIYISYGLYLFVTSYWLRRQRDHYILRKSHTSMAVLAAIMQYILLTSHFSRFIFALEHLPGTLTVWRNYVFFPLYIVFSFQGRGMHLLFEYLWTRSIGPPNASGMAAHESDAGTGQWCGSWKVARNPAFWAWFKNYGAWIMAGTLASFHVGLALILPYLKLGGEFWTSAPCPLEVEAAGVLLTVTVYLVIWCPIMLIFLADVKDAYGLCRDLQLAVSSAIPFYSMYLVVRGYDFLQPLRKEIPASIFMLAAMAAVHTATVVRPLLRTLAWHPEGDRSPSSFAGTAISNDPAAVSSSIYYSQRPISLELVLDSPKLFPPFAAYSKNAFVWDSILFHQAVRRYHRVTSERPGFIASEAKQIYERFIARGAPCEMNLSYETASAIHQMVSQQLFAPTMFDEAHREVLRLVAECTYRNFLYTLDPASKAQYMVPLPPPYPR